MKIISGKSRILLDDSKSAAIRAVKTYNDVDDGYRVQTYITLMIMAYTKMFLSYFYKKIGDKYYEKEKNGHYKRRDGERIAWGLKICINEYEKKEIRIDTAIKENINYFIGLRNKIEHNYIDERDLEKIIFGELQAFLYNYNSLIKMIFNEDISKYLRMPLLVDFFNDEYKNVISSSGNKIIKYIDKFKKELPKSIQNSDNFSFKFIALPNTVNRNSAPAITFIKDEEIANQAIVSIREKIIEKEAVNVNCYLPQKIIAEVLKENPNLKYGNEYTKYHAASIFNVLDIRNIKSKETNESYCLYDAAFDGFVYKPLTKDLLISFFNNIPKSEMNEKNYQNKKIDIGNLK